MAARTKAQKAQFFRFRLKGWIIGSLAIISGFECSIWITLEERKRLKTLRDCFIELQRPFDVRTKIILEEQKRR